tara:strand:+ start:116 stop:280 length:165 start_codon:yes stop_codon:yes gene_type:complete
LLPLEKKEKQIFDPFPVVLNNQLITEVSDPCEKALLKLEEDTFEACKIIAHLFA